MGDRHSPEHLFLLSGGYRSADCIVGRPFCVASQMSVPLEGRWNPQEILGRKPWLFMGALIKNAANLMGFSGFSWGEISSYKIYKGHNSIYRFYNYSTGRIMAQD